MNRIEAINEAKKKWAEYAKAYKAESLVDLIVTYARRMESAICEGDDKAHAKAEIEYLALRAILCDLMYEMMKGETTK